MKVINKEKGIHGGRYYAIYKFDTGHQFNSWDDGSFFGYTKSGNFASVPTTYKLMRLASEYEDKRIQIPD